MIWYRTSSGPNKISVGQYQFSQSGFFFTGSIKERQWWNAHLQHKRPGSESGTLLALSGLQSTFFENSGWIYIGHDNIDSRWRNSSLINEQKNEKKSSIEKQFEIRNTFNAKILLHNSISFLVKTGEGMSMYLSVNMLSRSYTWPYITPALSNSI